MINWCFNIDDVVNLHSVSLIHMSKFESKLMHVEEKRLIKQIRIVVGCNRFCDMRL